MRAWSIWRWLGLIALGLFLTGASFTLAGGNDRHEPRYASNLERELCLSQARQQYQQQPASAPASRPAPGRQPENCEPPALLHFYLAGVAGTALFGLGLAGTAFRGFRTGGPGRKPLGQIVLGFGAIALVILMMIPVREEADRAICLIMCPPSRDDTFTAIFLGYFFLALVLLPIGLSLVSLGIVRQVTAWSRAFR